MRAPILLSLLALAGCTARFTGETPRPYHCSTLDAGECPGDWTCNLAAQECIDPDAGLPLACGRDEDCGGGWRCSPDHRCVDRTVEGELTSATLPTGSALLSPRFPTSGSVVSSTPSLAAGGMRWASDLLLFGAPSLWLLNEDSRSSTQVKGSRVSIPLPLLDGGAVVTTRLLDGGVLHSLWSLAPGGVSVISLGFSADAGAAQFISGDYTGLSVVQSPGVGPDGPSSLLGAALLIRPARSEAWQASADQPAALFAAGTTSVAWVASPGRPECEFVAALTDGGVVKVLQPDGGVHGASGRYLELRVGYGLDLSGQPSVLGLRDLDGNLSSFSLCPDEVLPAASSCPDGGVLDGWAFQEVASALALRRVCTSDAQQTSYLGDAPGQTLYDPLVVANAGPVTWARSRSLSTLTQVFPAGQAMEVSLAHPPDTLLRFQGQVVAARGADAYLLDPAGFLHSATYVAPSDNVAAAGSKFYVSRAGVVNSGGLWAAAFPSAVWDPPQAPVQLRTVGLRDGGTLLALAHDDIIDVAQLKIPTREPVQLSPAVVPVPGLSVADLALHLSRDGGFVSGYAISGGVISQITATSPTRWLSSRLSLATDALHVYYDGDRPRAVLADGTVLGLTAMVGLTAPTPEPLVAATSSCGAPIGLADDAVFVLTDGGWQGLPGFAPGASFSGGRIFTLDAGVYAFDKTGHAWSFEVPCP